MILLTGISSEPPLRLAINAAEDANIPYAVFNQRDSQHTDITLDLDSNKLEGILRLQEKIYRLNAFAGVYVRLMDYHHLPENQALSPFASKQSLIEKSYIFHDLLMQWLEVADCRVMNHGRAMASNMSKPYQAQFILKVGFLTPLTLITNHEDEVRKFLDEHKRIIYKSLSSVRSIVKKLSDVKMNDLKNVAYLPTQFQNYVPGTNIRVHVVGDVLFATEIISEAIDYRYAGCDDLDVQMVPITLPPEIESRCFALSKSLDLPLCGIDLKVTPNGEYYCFEVNPSPGYSYYQQNSGQDIAKAIVHYLEYGTAKVTL